MGNRVEPEKLRHLLDVALVVLSGAGISAESGLVTFRDADGLWENYSVEDVATAAGWVRNPALVQEFYNKRRKQALDAQPNVGHRALVALEEKYDVTIITQNVDNLHEKAGSSKVVHLHGELSKMRSSGGASRVYDIGGDEIQMGDLCEEGHQLRPHIVWFGEEVPMMEVAFDITQEADIFIVVGTSLAVYPAAGLAYAVPNGVPIFVVDPNTPDMRNTPNVTVMAEPATTGLTKLTEQLLSL